MALRLWSYYFRHAFSNILAHRLVHVISIGTISVSLFLFGLFMLLFINLQNWILDWGQSTLTMSVFLKDDVGEAERKKIESLLKKVPGAELKGFTSKDEAMRDLKTSLGAQSGLLDGLKKNPLPASFDLFFQDASDIPIDPKGIKAQVEKIEGVSEVQYTEKWEEGFKGIIYVMKLGGFILGGFLCLAILFIATNTIKLTIYSRREEIGILKLVGATDWFIKIPFLIEGLIQGILSGLIALSTLYLVFSLLTLKKIHVLGLPVLEIVFFPMGYNLFIVMMSLALGLFGGLIAVGRFFNL